MFAGKTLYVIFTSTDFNLSMFNVFVKLNNLRG